MSEICIFFFFFFQAEDGIRDYKVTGVQTCALPICQNLSEPRVHSVLTGAQIDGKDRQTFHHRSHLLEAKPVGPRRITVAEGTSQVALVGQAKSKRKSPSRSRPDQRRVRNGLGAGLSHGPVSSPDGAQEWRAIICT